ncbi:restriction endonuclease subunit S [Caldifermentibacillus hisashii]|uniref:restriction endonuclease subunit S n=1 Tax=Caldifermentibacillus hisashii TaxID=996558 RepID=UPI0034D70052
MRYNNFVQTELGLLPEDWEVRTLGDELYIKGRIGWKGLKKDEYLVESPYRIINGSNIINNKIDWNNCGYISEERYNESPEIMLQKNDIVITKDGTIGKVAKINSLEKPTSVASGLFIIRNISKIIDTSYLFYYFNSHYFKGLVSSRTEGSVIPHLYQRDFVSMKIPLPRLEEQKLIATILSSLDEKIEINNEINKKLEEMAQAIFKHWFVDFEFPNENGEPYKSSGGEMVESELGMIPKGWKVTTLDNIVNISTKSINPQNYAERVFEHYSIPALDNNKTPEIQMGKEIKSNKYLIDDNVILISKLNPNTKRIWKPIPQYKFAICSTEFIVYVPKENNIFYYVYEFINSDYFSEMLVSHATGSTGSRQRVKPKDTLNFKIYLPPVELMVKFSKAVKPMHDSISLKNLEIQKLVLTRDTLLPKLMSGEIRVPVEE